MTIPAPRRFRYRIEVSTAAGKVFVTTTVTCLPEEVEGFAVQVKNALSETLTGHTVRWWPETTATVHVWWGV